MGRDRKTLVWGVLFLLLGGLWLLHSIGLRIRLFNDLIGSAMLLAGAAALALVVAGNPKRRSFWLIPSALLAAASAIHLGEAFRFMPHALEGLLVTGALAAALVVIHRIDTRRMWALWCAWLAVIIGFTHLLGELGRFGERISGMVFLWGIAVPFVMLFLRRGREWPLIVAGSLVALGLTDALENFRAPERLQAITFFLGLAVTFAAVHVLGRPGKVRWARIAAFACAGVGLIGALTASVMLFVLPVGLILAGAWLIIAGRGGDAAVGSEGPPVPPAPPAPDAG